MGALSIAAGRSVVPGIVPQVVDQAAQLGGAGELAPVEEVPDLVLEGRDDTCARPLPVSASVEGTDEGKHHALQGLRTCLQRNHPVFHGGSSSGCSRDKR